ncbi:MAG: hypothetical protein EXX96DRAFT_533822 [Benjaminiella poitrasii]|nr:MAG: hypothetical protein EXX96DRAFT_533822 [Benjaminiella poitrasii]
MTLPSIQCMLNGAQAKSNIHVQEKTNEYFKQNPSHQTVTTIPHPKPLEPTFYTSIDTVPKFNFRQSTSIGRTHTRTHSDITPLSITLDNSQSNSNTIYHHRRTQSDHTFEYTQRHTPEEDSDSVDSGSQVSSSHVIYGRARLSSPQGGSHKYCCPYCQKGFSRPSSLKTHIFSHTGEKPYICNYPTCNRSFSVQSNMRRHMKVHQNTNKLAGSYNL